MRISAQSSRLVSDVPAIAKAHFLAEADPYHRRDNPTGYLNLGTAENRLMWDLLEPWLSGARSSGPQSIRYAPLHGTVGLRELVAQLLSGVCATAVNADDLIVVSGASAALDIVASTLCDPGDAIVVPAPFYAAFTTDLTGRSGATLIAAPMGGTDGFDLRPEVIDRVLHQARAAGERVRAIALSSPNNPVGSVYDASTLHDVLAVAAAHDVDVIADEIYAQSVFGAQFTSLVDPAVKPPDPARVHLIWGFAKDFGLPGLKVGVLHTRDPEVAAAARALAYFAPVSTDTQELLAAMLRDEAWVAGFLAVSRGRLARSYADAAAALDSVGIPYAPAAAGFSLWADLRRWLATPTFRAEAELWQCLFEVNRVSVLPGEVFGAAEPGWFRVCHTTDPAIVHEAAARISRLPHSTEDHNDERRPSPG